MRWKVRSGLGQYFLRGLMIVIATGLIPLSPLSIVSTLVMWERSHWLGKICSGCRLKEFQESMDRCTGPRDITEIPLKTALNQSINGARRYVII